MKLTAHGYDTYSQFGEDGIIQHIFSKIGTETKFAVEFGASDDLACSNVAHLWKDHGWSALLIEADQNKANLLSTKVGPSCQVLCHQVRPMGPYTIDAILKDHDCQPVDFMSIDVDGNDYKIWESMQIRPKVVCVEFNPTVPPHISIYQEYSGTMMGFGASLAAFIELGRVKHYEFIGATEINAFFVGREYIASFEEYERDPMKLFPLTNYAYLVTDFLGSALGAGTLPPWGLRVPYDGPFVAGNVYSLAGTAVQSMDIYQAKYGEIVRWMLASHPNIANPDYAGSVGTLGPITARNLLRAYMQSQIEAICIAIDNVSSPDHIEWVYKEATEHKYHAKTGGGIIALTRSQQ